jgi:hypothetical protein
MMVFLDLDPHDGLAPGQHWRQALAAAASRCQAVLCLISPEWNASSWCLNEFLLAKQFGKYVFPIIVSAIDISELPAEITSNHQVVDLVHDPEGLLRLKEGLKRAGLDPETFPFAAGRPPYPGFEPLTEQDAAIFFGREAPIVRGLDRLRSMREVGPSACWSFSALPVPASRLICAPGSGRACSETTATSCCCRSFGRSVPQ